MICRARVMSDPCTPQAIDSIGASASAIATLRDDTSVHSGDTNSNSSKSVKRSLSWEMADAEEVADGYTLVQRGNKKSKQGANPGTSAIQEECRQSNPTPPQETYRLSFPKGVTPRDRAIWLADVAHRHRNLSVQPRLTAKSIIAVTRDLDTVKFLTEIGHPYKNTTMRLIKITEDNKQTKVVIRNYPSYMPLEYIEDLPSVLWIERDTRRDNRAPRNQVFALWQGELPTTLQFPGMRPCKVERYVGKPPFCGNCQKWGHRVWQCDGRTKCGFCAGNHDTKLCKEKIDNGEKITPKCPNCYQQHNAWSLRCPQRPDSHLRADKGPVTPAVESAPPISEFPSLSQGTHQPPSHLTHHQPMPLHTSPNTSGRPTTPATPHHPWTRLHPSHPPPQRAQEAPQHGTRIHHQALESVPQAPAPPPAATERQPVNQPTDAVNDANAQLLKEVEAIRQEVKTLRNDQTSMKKETQELKIMCVSQQAIQTKLTSDITAIKDLLSQIVVDIRANRQTYRDNGMTMEADTPPPPHRPQDSCFDLTLTAMVIDNKMMTEQPPLPPTITHRDQPVRLPIQTQAAALLTPVCPVTQLSQPATMHQANPITEPTSPLSQPLPAVKSKHHQPTRQSQAQ